MKANGKTNTKAEKRKYKTFRPKELAITCPHCGYESKGIRGEKYLCGNCIEKDAIEMVFKNET